MRHMISFLICVVCYFIGSAMAAPATSASAPSASSGAASVAIVVQDQVALRAAPRESAQRQAFLWQGEAVEVRGQRMDYVQVYDYRRERGGFVHASQLRRVGTQAADAGELLNLARFLREQPGSEALGIGFTMAYLQAAPAAAVNGAEGAEALEALGGFADRLARRASIGSASKKPTETTLAAHLDVAARYGIKFNTYEREGRMQVCYDGEALRRVLGLPATPAQKAHAVLALTRSECVPPGLHPKALLEYEEWRAGILDRAEIGKLPSYLKNRVHMRRAAVWSSLAYLYTRRDGLSEGDAGKVSREAAQRAIAELAGVAKTELPDVDLAAHNDAIMRVNASRWAAQANRIDKTKKSGLPTIQAEPGEPGQTCVYLVDGKHDVKNPLARRCTYGVAWNASVTRNREATALTLAVQTLPEWRELWVFRKDASGWSINILPPAPLEPGAGYIEFAGWAPGGKQLLVAREARGEGKYRRNFEVLKLDTLTPERQASDPTLLGAFNRWQDPAWKRESVSLR